MNTNQITSTLTDCYGTRRFNMIPSDSGYTIQIFDVHAGHEALACILDYKTKEAALCQMARYGYKESKVA